MALRQLLIRLLEYEKDLDRQVVVRVVRRGPAPPGEIGSVEEVKHVPLTRLHSGNLVIEQSDLTGTPWERA